MLPQKVFFAIGSQDADLPVLLSYPQDCSVFTCPTACPTAALACPTRPTPALVPVLARSCPASPVGEVVAVAR
jgi:hypothetical protein